jgi:hypothetical protein
MLDVSQGRKKLYPIIYVSIISSRIFFTYLTYLTYLPPRCFGFAFLIVVFVYLGWLGLDAGAGAGCEEDLRSGVEVLVLGDCKLVLC